MGFAPIVGKKPKFLVLGSMPGQRSLTEVRYYAHPRNSFWPIMTTWLGLDGDLSYAERCRQLTERGLAVWDVLHTCYRPGSLDSAIQAASAVPNDFSAFFDRYPTIETLLFNGKAAQRLFQRFFPAEARQQIPLPSTSPAYAAMSHAEKKKIWLEALG